MDRRKFIKRISMATGGSMLLGGIPIQALSATGHLQRVVSNTDTDRVLILIQLHGGNDGLNTIIPINMYNEYFNFRPNIAIPDNGPRKFITLDTTLPEEKQAGLHPDMTGVKSLYDEGKCAIIHGVAYENFNQSHFRSRDIMFMGGGYDDEFGSGWMGRYLDDVFPGYPEAFPNPEMEDPLAIEIGRGVSLAFHRENGIPASLSLTNPQQFYDLISGVGGELPTNPENSYYGQELQWIKDIELKSNQYAGRLRDVFNAGGATNINYPTVYPNFVPDRFLNNTLSGQLKLIAQLIAGGCKSKIYLARTGGFDLHANQVDSFDTSIGPHAALLFHLSSAMEAFQRDLKDRGIEDRVLSVTTSEFGRRVRSNFSFGTDHGTSAPMFVFGKGVKPGVLGNNPDLNDLSRGNLRIQHDYRQVFTTILQDWMCASDQALADTMFDSFTDSKLDFLDSEITGVNDSEESSTGSRLQSCFPNPVEDRTTFAFYLEEGRDVKLELFNTNGNKLRTVIDEFYSAGDHTVQTDLFDLEKGAYLYVLTGGNFKFTKSLVKV